MISQLGVAVAGHQHRLSELLDLARQAEELGFRAFFADGDTSLRPRQRRAEIHHSWTATVALLSRTERIEIASLRLVHHWNAAQLAQAVASAWQLAPGRLRFIASIGGQPADARFGLPQLTPGERIAWLGEQLAVLPRLWAGERVSASGRFVHLDRVQLRPALPGQRVPIAVAGRGPRLVELIARRADGWDMNLPPVPRWVHPAERVLRDALERCGRSRDAVSRSMWIPLRVGQRGGAALRREYRRLNPWFSALSDAEVDRAVVTGSPAGCLARLGAIRSEFGLDLPVLDLTGCSRGSCSRVLEALARAG